MHTVYTLGYTGTQPEQIKTMAKKLTAVVVDIRYSPRSRVAHWNKPQLKAVLGDLYLHVRELGNVNYKNGLAIKLADPIKASLILKPILLRQPVILLCVCKDVDTCHRRTAADYLGRQVFKTRVVHLSILDLDKPQPKQDEAQQDSLL